MNKCLCSDGWSFLPNLGRDLVRLILGIEIFESPHFNGLRMPSGSSLTLYHFVTYQGDRYPVTRVADEVVVNHNNFINHANAVI